MTRRRPPRKVNYFEPVPPRLARYTIIESASLDVSSTGRAAGPHNPSQPPHRPSSRPRQSLWRACEVSHTPSAIARLS